MPGPEKTTTRTDGLPQQATLINGAPFRNITTGVERISAGYDLPRHRHYNAYVTIVLAGAYEQFGYVGRLKVQAGDVLLQPTMDCHADHMLSQGVELLRIPWSWTDGFGGIVRGGDIEAIRKAAAADTHEAASLVRSLLTQTTAEPSIDDWEDALALRLRDWSVKIGDMADEFGMSRETLSRGFARAYGASPAAFRSELRVREAWLNICATGRRLSDIAVDTGFADQPHMTRAIREFTGSTPASIRRSAFLPSPVDSLFRAPRSDITG
jgi:AraC-like DNA-binding protein